MKTSIKVLFTAILIIQGLSLKAQNTTGVYLNENDYKDHKLTYASNTDKIQLNEFFGGNTISVINDGKKVNLNKNEIFGYRLANQDYRFYNNVAYKVIDTVGFAIYSREKLVQDTKGYKPATQYFYSVNNKAVKELTIANLTASFPQATNFRYSLQSNFRSDADLISYDHAANQYKIKYLYLEHKRVMASN
ncbi:hypothetical protein [Mucilaginibacter jinjuensis]|uniref:DKNYY family protein n=1 Tax=Mucilaginibacter jinjuensis TaxID=1176721 RepID=A0ABY7T7K1_9SPHI|nr:hypothetical protein [Mucilaginibacter jinjuensis]WCT12465.1 hypothetical protein PQO05_00785 [Mucilaginibacter jinjuensis]